jgi:hypothetical protein
MSRLLAMLPHGAVADAWTNNSDRSFDVAAVRYVTVPRDNAPTGDAKARSPQGSDTQDDSSQRTGAFGGGIRWGDDLNLALGKSCNAARERASFTLPAHARATHLAFVTQLACADQIADAVPVLSLTLRDETGHSSELQLNAGRDTSEWAYDCADVRARVRHSRAHVFTTYATERQPAPCVGHDYESEIATRAPFEIKTIELRWTGGDNGSLAIKKLTLVDRERNVSTPVTTEIVALGDATRWRLAEETNDARVYENLRAQPRAWLVNEVLTLAPEDALASSKTSRLPDGRPFDPARTALVEEPQSFSTSSIGAQAKSGSTPAPNDDARAQESARIVEESDWKIQVHTGSSSPSFLVLSDAYYPGWRASVDGREAHIYQTDYALRGVSVPAGVHVVGFELRPRSFRVGLTLSLSALVALTLFAAPFNPLWKTLGAQTKEARR